MSLLIGDIIAENSMSAGTFSANTIYMGGANISNTFVTINTGGTVTGQTSFSELSAGTFSASTISGGTIYSGSTNVSNIFTTQGVTNLINAQLPTKANLSGDTFTGSVVAPVLIATTSISAVTLSASTIFSGNTNLNNVFGSLPIQQLIINQLPTKANLSGATFTGNIVVPSLTATTSISAVNLSAATMISGSTNLYNIFNTLIGYVENNTTATTTSTTFISATTLSINTQSGLHCIMYQFALTNSNANAVSSGKVDIDGVEFDVSNIRWGAGNLQTLYSGFKILNLSAGQHDITIFYRAASNTAGIMSRRILVFKTPI